MAKQERNQYTQNIRPKSRSVTFLDTINSSVVLLSQAFTLAQSFISKQLIVVAN